MTRVDSCSYRSSLHLLSNVGEDGESMQVNTSSCSTSAMKRILHERRAVFFPFRPVFCLPMLTVAGLLGMLFGHQPLFMTGLPIKAMYSSPCSHDTALYCTRDLPPHVPPLMHHLRCGKSYVRQSTRVAVYAMTWPRRSS